MARRTAQPVPPPSDACAGETVSPSAFAEEAESALRALDTSLASAEPAHAHGLRHESVDEAAARIAGVPVEQLHSNQLGAIRDAYRRARSERQAAFDGARAWLRCVDFASKRHRNFAFSSRLESVPPRSLGKRSRRRRVLAAVGRSEELIKSRTGASAAHDALEDPSDDHTDNISVSCSEALIQLRIFQPSQPDTLQQELICLASQPLDEVTHAIDCEFDHVAHRSGCYRHGGYMYLPGTFVLDTTSGEKACDFSWSMRDVARRVGARTPDFADKGLQSSFNVVPMCNTSFDSFRGIVLGRLYSYCHQGVCEHPVSICDVRMKHKSDESDRHKYPLEVFRATSKIDAMCHVCEAELPAYATVDDELAPHNPGLMCEDCYCKLHPEGQKGESESFSVIRLQQQQAWEEGTDRDIDTNLL